MNGRIEIVSLFRKGGEEETVRVKLPAAGHVYNLRTGQYLGRAASVEAPVVPNRPTWLATAPATVPAVTLALSADSVPRGSVATVKVTAPGAAGLHAVYLEATTPAGEPAEWLRQELMVDGGGTACELPVAFNDPVGRWTLGATDLYTGKTTTVAYTVK